jgi:hypothetical protein
MQLIVIVMEIRLENALSKIRFQNPTMETIFQAPFIWIKAWNKKLWKNPNLALLHVL